MDTLTAEPFVISAYPSTQGGPAQLCLNPSGALPGHHEEKFRECEQIAPSRGGANCSPQLRAALHGANVLPW